MFFRKKDILLIVEHPAWRQMKENHQIYSPSQFCLRPHLINEDADYALKKIENHVSLNKANTFKSRAGQK